MCRAILCIDIETYSEVDLPSSGVYAYAEHPSFEIMLFGYSCDGGPVKVVDLARGEELPEDIYEALTDPDVLKTAYNANFERVCLTHYFGELMRPEQWRDTKILAAELGLPGSLAEVGAALGLPEDKQKLREGRALISYFAKPCKPSKANGGRTRNLPEHDPEKWEKYIEYNRQDVVAEMAIAEKCLPDLGDWWEREQELWEIDQEINDRGVRLDRQLAENAVRLDKHIKARYVAEAKALTGMENPNSPTQIKDWIKQETDVEVDSIAKDKIKPLLERVGNAPKIERFFELRTQLARTSIAKYSKMLQCVCEDGRIRGLTQFYGANRTGRWAGRLVQMQNLAKNKMPDAELDAARGILRAGEFDLFEALFDDPADTMSQLIRTAFIPREGCRFVVADFSAIEARVLAWLAGEEWRLDVFKNGGDIYCASASKMFKVPVEKHGVNGHLRQKGKIAELALGYGGAEGALRAMGALDMGLDEDELRPLVNQWRTANPHVTKFWWRVDECARQLIRTSKAQIVRPGIRMRRTGKLMRIELPSGRELSYVMPRLISEPDGRESITYMGTIQGTGGWGRIETYGPKIVENIVQAVARDCLAESMRKLIVSHGVKIVFHVHDEVICEVGENDKSLAEIAAIMGEPISWAPGLPLNADAYECDFYRKD
ncbi:MAG: DNA polymerase [Lentihominibacter sp.]|uniref:DNA polymerase n=1 Tax=Lentihominibacter sp. TaxID=2944216 RepID=UPI002A91B665|nr:DNA polymerase [Lentihominibacter sp.]MDY5287620.1 DNA polymerase [Lentihominibacter sp.]